MAARIVRGKFLRWGNSYGIRVSRADKERMRLRAGQDVDVVIKPGHGKVDYSDIAVIRSGDPHGSRDHDRLYGEAMNAEARRWRRRRA